MASLLFCGRRFTHVLHCVIPGISGANIQSVRAGRGWKKLCGEAGFLLRSELCRLPADSFDGLAVCPFSDHATAASTLSLSGYRTLAMATARLCQQHLCFQACE